MTLPIVPENDRTLARGIRSLPGWRISGSTGFRFQPVSSEAGEPDNDGTDNETSSKLDQAEEALRRSTRISQTDA